MNEEVEQLASKYRPVVVPDRAEERRQGVYRWENDGTVVVLSAFWSDPTKASEEWLDNQRKGATEDGFQRETLISFESWKGKKVYPEFRKDLHQATKSLPFNPSLPILVGIDVVGMAAAVWGQLYPMTASRGQITGFRLHILAEILSQASVQEFGETILAVNQTRFPTAKRFMYVADPAAFYAGTNHDKRSAADILRMFCGIHMTAGPVNLTERLEAVRRWLKPTVVTQEAGDPCGAFQLDPECRLIQEGFAGGYFYKQIGAQGAGRYREIPEKQCDSSHIMNALEYLAGRVLPTSAREEDEEYEPIKFNPDRVIGALV